MTSSFAFDRPSSQRQRIEQRAREAGIAIRKRFGEEQPSVLIDLIFTHYLLGLVTVLQPDAEPEQQLESVCALAALLLAPDDIQRALHSVPPGEETYVSRALNSAEKIGQRDGETLLADPTQGVAVAVEPRTATTATT